MMENIQLPVISASIISFLVSFLVCLMFVKINTNFKANKKINIQVISTSEIKISVLVNKNDAKKALSVLHKEFKLDN